ncbi:MAG: DUF4738 domain-containing protein [Bacteroidales bacterium]|nr:DUF4738 domain-containing protein [Bacteroidales bacterium]MDD4210233.1 DUF4738 domain-containing protein [Bacteroidales bacterium]
MKALFSCILLLITLIEACKRTPHTSFSIGEVAIHMPDTTIEYYPKNYQKTILDTLLDDDNNIRLYLSIATRMDKIVSQCYEDDSTHFRLLNYRDNTLQVKFMMDEEIILDTSIVKEALRQIGDEEFLKQSILYSAWINDYDKETQTVEVRFNVLVPDTDWSYLFMLTADKDGHSKIVLDEIH